jgi:hypothetical protein
LYIEAKLGLLSSPARPDCPCPGSSAGEEGRRKTKYLLGLFGNFLMKIAEIDGRVPGSPRIGGSPGAIDFFQENQEKDEET